MPQRIDWRDLFAEGRRPLVGMVHLKALPGSPGFTRTSRMQDVIDSAAADVDALVTAGFDAVLFVNEADVPYPDTASAVSLASLAAVVARTRPASIPFGVEFLFDASASLACAVATGASFIRGGVIGAWETASGIRLGGTAALMRERAALGAEHVGVFSVAHAEMAFPLSDVDLPHRLRVACHQRAMDAVLLSGAMPGMGADTSSIAEIRSAVGGMPVLANSGVTASTVTQTLSIFDGCLVGSYVKHDGLLGNGVDSARADALVARATSSRVV